MKLNLVRISAIILAVAAVGSLASAVLAAAGPTVSVDAGLAPKRTAADVVSVAQAYLDVMAARPEAAQAADSQKAVVSARATTSGLTQPAAVGGSDHVVWVVRATGTFVGLRVPPGQDAIVGTSGYIVIDDATGDILEMGMP
jgi:hypothetical protein